MNTPPPFTSSHIDQLLAQQRLSSEYPWNTDNESIIDAHYRKLCDRITQVTGALARIEWDHYGSGYASFIDAWFYRPSADFAPAEPIAQGEGYSGLVILLSRWSPYFVFMEGVKSWHAKGGAGYLPCFDMVDQLSVRGVRDLAAQIQPLLEQEGLGRLSQADLLETLAPDAQIPTILSDPPFKAFDALFYWED